MKRMNAKEQIKNISRETTKQIFENPVGIATFNTTDTGTLTSYAATLSKALI